MSTFDELKTLDPRNAYTGTRIEVPSPHKLAVLMLVQQYLKAKKAALDTGVLYPAHSRRHFCMLLLKIIQRPDMAYNDLHHMISKPCHHLDLHHLKCFENAMADLYTLGIEALFDFAEMQNIEKMLSEQLGVSQYSIVGLYIRRVGVVLERLSFPEMMSLYKNVRLYYKRGILAMASRSRTRVAEATPTPVAAQSSEVNTATSENTEDDDTKTEVPQSDSANPERDPHSKWAPKQADIFVAQQCKLLEGNELRALSPIELQQTVEQIIEDNPLNSHAYFLAYMNQLRLNDYFSAVDVLHRAHDRCPNQMMSNYEHKGMQYFSVNCAVMQANFNHREESLAALRECIMMAQEAGDKRCLDLANSWCCLLNSRKFEPFSKELTDRKDPNMIQWLFMSIHYVIKYAYECAFEPLDMFDMLQSSDELCRKKSLSEHIVDSTALRSALWTTYGRYELSALYGQLLLNLRRSWNRGGDIGNPESLGKVLASLGLWLHIQGKSDLSDVVLAHACERFPRHPHASNWMVSRCRCDIQLAIFRAEWDEAMSLCSVLWHVNKNEGNLQRGTVLVARRSCESADAILNALLEKPDLDALTRVNALLQLAYSSIQPTRITPRTVDLLTSAAVLAEVAYMHYEEAIIDMVYAHVLLLLDMPHKAYELMSNCIDVIHTSGGIYDRARADFMLARCAIAIIDDDQPEKKKAALEEMLEDLEDTADLFRSIEAYAKALDIYVFIAQVYDYVGDEEERNAFATKFVDNHRIFPVAGEFLRLPQ